MVGGLLKRKVLLKIDASFALMLLRFVLCNEKLMTWLRTEAAKSETPIDDTAVKIIEWTLCGSEETK